MPSLSTAQIKRRDQEFEALAETGLRKLMQLRHDCTIGDPQEGLSFAAYARLVGRNESVIRRSAHGWRIQSASREADLRPLDAYHLADASEAGQIAIIATADAVGTTPAEAKQARRPEVKIAKQAARKAVDAAIETGKDDEEVRKAAERAAKAAEAEYHERKADEYEGMKARAAKRDETTGVAESRRRTIVLEVERAIVGWSADITRALDLYSDNSELFSEESIQEMAEDLDATIMAAQALKTMFETGDLSLADEIRKITKEVS